MHRVLENRVNFDLIIALTLIMHYSLFSNKLALYCRGEFIFLSKPLEIEKDIIKVLRKIRVQTIMILSDLNILVFHIIIMRKIWKTKIFKSFKIRFWEKNKLYQTHLIYVLFIVFFLIIYGTVNFSEMSFYIFVLDCEEIDPLYSTELIINLISVAFASPSPSQVSFYIICVFLYNMVYNSWCSIIL